MLMKQHCYVIGTNIAQIVFNPLSANSTKWSNTLKQFVADLPTNCLSVFDHFVKLAFKELRNETLPLHLVNCKTYNAKIK